MSFIKLNGRYNLKISGPHMLSMVLLYLWKSKLVTLGGFLVGAG
jgi:hypothetical protein